MNPYPFSALNHLTVPCAMNLVSPCKRSAPRDRARLARSARRTVCHGWCAHGYSTDDAVVDAWFGRPLGPPEPASSVAPHGPELAGQLRGSVDGAVSAGQPPIGGQGERCAHPWLC